MRVYHSCCVPACMHACVRLHTETHAHTHLPVNACAHFAVAWVCECKCKCSSTYAPVYQSAPPRLLPLQEPSFKVFQADATVRFIARKAAPLIAATASVVILAEDVAGQDKPHYAWRAWRACRRPSRSERRREHLGRSVRHAAALRIQHLMLDNLAPAHQRGVRCEQLGSERQFLAVGLRRGDILVDRA
jgi:hypothetical protein